MQMKNKTTTFLKSMKGEEELPTPKKSNKLESMLIDYIKDKNKFYEFEKFLTQNK
jgi:hypothetical protein